MFSDNKCVIYCDVPPMMGGGSAGKSAGASGSAGSATVSAGNFKNIEVTDTGTIKKIKNNTNNRPPVFSCFIGLFILINFFLFFLFIEEF